MSAKYPKDPMEIGWTRHKGKRIFIVDYRGIIHEKDMILMTKKIYTYLQKESKTEALLCLVDLSGCFATIGFMEEARELERTLVDQYIVKRAIVGISGSKETLLRVHNLFAKNKLKSFQSRGAALEFLIAS